MSSTPGTGPRRVAIAVNPSAGKGRAAALGVATGERLVQAGYDVLDVTSETAREAADRATSAVASGIDALVVVGGDGMVNIGVNACAGTGTPLGVVAAGTGNDIAASLGLPVRDIPAAVDVITAGTVRRIDAVRRVDWTGEGPQWFAGVLCGGFDAVVNERANGWAWPRGKMRYNLAIARELPVFKPLKYELELDGESWVTEAMLVALGNGTRYGGGMHITPDARYDDGLLDVLVVGPMSVPRLLTVFPKVFSGAHITHPAVTVKRARRVRLQTDDIVAYADGERFGPLPLEVEVVPSSLSVLVPADVA
ncbi:diacylglycerol kinase [Angustibacter peucedani]